MSTQQSNSNNRFMPWLIGGLVILGGLNVVQLVNGNKTGDKLETAQTELDKEKQLKTELEQQYNDAIAQLEQMKSQNTELNSLIDQQKAELESRKGQIAGMISKKEFSAVKGELARFKAQADGYVKRIAELEEMNKQLGTQVSTLSSEKTGLEENLAKERTEKEQISGQKAAIEAEKARIEAERATYAKKTEIGAVVRVAAIQTTGYSVRESGKEKSKTHAKNIDRLKFCFNTLENRVADSGRETFYLRILDPTGVAIASSSNGGGVYKLSDGREVQYTTTKQIDFKNDAENVCAVWDTKGNTTLVKGKYTVEFYNKGYLAGKSDFELK